MQSDNPQPPQTRVAERIEQKLDFLIDRCPCARAPAGPARTARDDIAPSPQVGPSGAPLQPGDIRYTGASFRMKMPVMAKVGAAGGGISVVTLIFLVIFWFAGGGAVKTSGYVAPPVPSVQSGESARILHKWLSGSTRYRLTDEEQEEAKRAIERDGGQSK